MYCRSCRAEMSDNAVACTKCGTPRNSGFTFCPQCGAKTNRYMDVCSSCGVSLRGAYRPVSSPYYPQPSGYYVNNQPRGPYGGTPAGQPTYQQGGAPYNQPPYQQGGQPPYQQQSGYSRPKSKTAAGLLGIFLGGLGIHNFYMGYTGKAVTQLLLTVIFSILASLSLFVWVIGIFMFIMLLAVPAAMWIWGFIEGIIALAGNKTDAKGVPLV